MKITELKINEIFQTDSGTKFKYLGIPTESETRHNKWKKDRYKCKQINTGEIFFFNDRVLIIKLKNVK